jgi:hypothetical protein
MGADLILVSVPGFVPTPERREALVKLLETENLDYEEIRDMLGLGDDPQNEVNAAIRETILQAFDAIFNGSREVTTVPAWGGNPSLDYVYVTGGMSWGDTPSDAYNGFGCMTFEPTINLLNQWNREDKER